MIEVGLHQHDPAPARVSILTLLVLRYLVETERFDRTLPGSWAPFDPDVWMPREGEYRRLMMDFARERHRELRSVCKAAGFSMLDVQRERERLERMRFVEQERLLAEHQGELSAFLEPKHRPDDDGGGTQSAEPASRIDRQRDYRSP